MASFISMLPRARVVAAGFGLLLLLLPAVDARQPEEPVASDGSMVDGERGMPVFEGSLDVTLVDLYVTVLGPDGRPVTGLTSEDFQVFEDGQPVEITNFEELRAEPVAGSGPAGPDSGAAADSETKGRYVALLFDEPSLESRRRRDVVESIAEIVRDGLERDDRFLIARNRGGLEIVKPFSANEPALIAALGSVADSNASGDALKSQKRLLKREIFRIDLFRASRQPLGQQGATAFDVEWSRMQSQRLMGAIEAVRRQEYDRIKLSLHVLREMILALSGLEGRKAVVWVGEDMALRPAVDIYDAFYRKAAALETVLNLVRPEIWGQDLELTPAFRAVAATAQSCGTTLFMVDASDRHRESGTADYSPPNVTSIIAGELGGSLWTPGVDLHSLHDVTAGAQYMALSTGGSLFTNTRNAEFLTESLSDQLGSYYFIGYRPPEPPDGRRHAVEVRVVGKGLRVRHHENVLNRTAPQRLTDIAFSRLRLDVGSNHLELDVTLEEPEAIEDRRYVQPIRIDMPVRKLVLLPDGDRRVGQILVAFAVLDADGNTAPPQLLRLRLDIAAGQYAEDAMATQRVRLMVREGTQRIAVGVRDEVSGVESSVAVSLAPESL